MKGIEDWRIRRRPQLDGIVCDGQRQRIHEVSLRVSESSVMPCASEEYLLLCLTALIFRR